MYFILMYEVCTLQQIIIIVEGAVPSTIYGNCNCNSTRVYVTTHELVQFELENYF